MRIWRFAFCVLMCAVLAPAGIHAYAFQPHEPLDPAKAQSLPLTPLTIESHGKLYHLKVEVAATDTQREIGLMHRSELGKDRGMLFVFDPPERLKFWMRNTFIPLDMLFMTGDGKVADIIENEQPHDERPVGPPAPMAAQLELPAGTVARLGLKRGDVVHHAALGTLMPPALDQEK